MGKVVCMAVAGENERGTNFHGGRTGRLSVRPAAGKKFT